MNPRSIHIWSIFDFVYTTGLSAIEYSTVLWRYLIKTLFTDIINSNIGYVWCYPYHEYSNLKIFNTSFINLKLNVAHWYKWIRLILISEPQCFYNQHKYLKCF